MISQTVKENLKKHWRIIFAGCFILGVGIILILGLSLNWASGTAVTAIIVFLGIIIVLGSLLAPKEEQTEVKECAIKPVSPLEEGNKKMKQQDLNKHNLSAFLGYYSSTGMSHTAIFVAFIFGLFIVLSILSGQIEIGRTPVSFVLLSIVYWLLWIGGSYSLLKFSYYFRVTSYILEHIGAYKKLFDLDGLFKDEHVEKPSHIPHECQYAEVPLYDPRIYKHLRAVYRITTGELKNKWILRGTLAVYLAIGVFPYIAVLLTKLSVQLMPIIWVW
ncbi:MAG: hypothetical protein ABIH76_08080 [Candidatus Bathyarchaeota archaeon]